jgi:hypothetical protein
MRTVLETCVPRKSIVEGTFNPEIFTASLGPVINFYKTGSSAIDTIYTDAEAFFKEATYPTEGLKQTVTSVFRRISGDASAPSIYRLETAFGGGKTHSLIACVHIAYRGKELANVTADLIDKKLLPNKGSIIVAGIAGDEIPVNKTTGDKLVPYTLWGELAFQIGGKKLYEAVKQEANSFAAPGLDFLEKVLGEKKVLIMLDELAQYAARLEVAHKNGASQLAAFIMSLNGYAKNHPGIALIITLAGTTDAFSRQTEKLTKLLNDVSKVDISKGDAVTIAENATKGVTSVTMRDATPVTPVQGYEISSVLGKRLFQSIDDTAAKEAAKEYGSMYSKNKSLLPQDATTALFQERITANYPFHPTLIDFLNQKLAQAENFQGTRGVLRVLAMTVRSIWSKKPNISMIHTSDIDMENSIIVSEILGRTGSADLLNVLTADIGSTESHSLKGGLSNAQRLDNQNPHPDHIPLYEMTWKNVFLNSLVGRSEGKTSKVFGITQQDAIFATATPVATPTQVRMALDAINENAFYLRYEDGKYYAYLEPTINSVLAMIRQTVDGHQIKQHLRTITSELVKETGTFHIENDVTLPQDIPDGREKPTIAVIAMDAGKIDPNAMFLTKGDNKPRERQNMTILLVPKTVEVISVNKSSALFETDISQSESWQRVEVIAKQVLAIKKLENNPQSYGIAPSKINDDTFKERKGERELALTTVVGEMYTSIYYPSTNNQIFHKEIRSSAGEGGVTIIGQIMEAMKDKLLTRENTSTSDLQSLATAFFFKDADKASIDETLTKLQCYRSWPMLTGKDVLESIIRVGVDNGFWIVYKMSNDPKVTTPCEIYLQDASVPLDTTLFNKGYSIMTLAGAKQRGWTNTDKVAPEKVQETIQTVLQTSGASTFGEISKAVKEQLGNVNDEDIDKQVHSLIEGGNYSLYKGDKKQTEQPEMLYEGYASTFKVFEPSDVLISKAEQSERGWSFTKVHSLKLEGSDNAKKVVNLLKHIGSLYTRNGAASRIDSLDLSDLQLPSGAKLRLSLEGLEAKDIKQLDEFFQIFADSVQVTNDTDLTLEIENPDNNDVLVKELRK